MKKKVYLILAVIAVLFSIILIYIYRKSIQSRDDDFSVQGIYKMCTFDGYLEMSVTEYRKQFARISDQSDLLQYLDSLELKPGDNLTYHNKEEKFIDVTLIPLTAEDYFEWKYTASIADKEKVIDYEIDRTIKDPDKLTVGAYIDTIDQIREKVAGLMPESDNFDSNSLQKSMDGIADECSNKLMTVSITGTYYSDMQSHVPQEDDETDDTSLNQFRTASEALLKMASDEYRQMSVNEFDQKVLEAFNDNGAMSQYFSDIQEQNEDGQTLSESDKNFLFITLPATVARNTAYVESITMNQEEKDAVMGNRELEQKEGTADCRVEYRLRYKIPNRDDTTVDERDKQIIQLENMLKEYIAGKSVDELKQMGDETLKNQFESMASACSNAKIVIAIDKISIDLTVE